MSDGMFARNDWAATVRLKTVNAAGKVVRLTSGTVTTFLSASKAPNATAIHASLTGVVSYTGKNGDWKVEYQGGVLSETLLDPVVLVGPVYVIIVQPDNIRAYADANYQASRAMEVVG